MAGFHEINRGEPSRSALQPRSGVFYGTSAVAILGSGLGGNLSDARCKFGRTLTAWYDAGPQKWYGLIVIKHEKIENS